MYPNDNTTPDNEVLGRKDMHEFWCTGHRTDNEVLPRLCPRLTCLNPGREERWDGPVERGGDGAGTAGRGRDRLDVTSYTFSHRFTHSFTDMGDAMEQRGIQIEELRRIQAKAKAYADAPRVWYDGQSGVRLPANVFQARSLVDKKIVRTETKLTE